MKFRPLHDYILIEKNKSEEKIGNLYIPDNAVEQSSIAKILAVGPGTKDVKISVKVGDYILISKDMGQHFMIEDQNVTLIKQENIITKLELL